MANDALDVNPPNADIVSRSIASCPLIRSNVVLTLSTLGVPAPPEHQLQGVQLFVGDLRRHALRRPPHVGLVLHLAQGKEDFPLLERLYPDDRFDRESTPRVACAFPPRSDVRRLPFSVVLFDGL